MRGVPRDKIPWYPLIDYGKCDLCGGKPKCKEFCLHNVFEVAEENGKKLLKGLLTVWFSARRAKKFVPFQEP
ncbi:MAG: hypothetical protein QW497_01995 [Candidatus Bathyarchaeia archaeon]